jgi:hypothetical protein
VNNYQDHKMYFSLDKTSVEDFPQIRRPSGRYFDITV